MKSVRIARGLYMVRIFYRGAMVVRLISAPNEIAAENNLLDQLGANACAN